MCVCVCVLLVFFLSHRSTVNVLFAVLPFPNQSFLSPLRYFSLEIWVRAAFFVAVDFFSWGFFFAVLIYFIVYGYGYMKCVSSWLCVYLCRFSLLHHFSYFFFHSLLFSLSVFFCISSTVYVCEYIIIFVVAVIVVSVRWFLCYSRFRHYKFYLIVKYGASYRMLRIKSRVERAQQRKLHWSILLSIFLIPMYMFGCVCVCVREFRTLLLTVLSWYFQFVHMEL